MVISRSGFSNIGDRPETAISAPPSFKQFHTNININHHSGLLFCEQAWTISQQQYVRLKTITIANLPTLLPYLATFPT